MASKHIKCKKERGGDRMKVTDCRSGVAAKKGVPLASSLDKKESQLGNFLACLPKSVLNIQFSTVSWEELEERSEEGLGSLKSMRKRITMKRSGSTDRK